MLAEYGIDPTDVAFRLSDTLPFIISKGFDPNASANNIRASMLDLKEAMASAQPQPPTTTKEEWLARRAAAAGPPRERKEHGKRNSAQGVSQELAAVPNTVPELPAAFLGRPELLDQLKAATLSADGATHASLTSAKAKHKSAVHGMGGVGKTTVAAALVNDQEMRAAFDKLLWVSVGQEPDVRELQASLLLQTNKQKLSTDVADKDVVDEIKEATKGLKILLVLDDVWEAKYVRGMTMSARRRRCHRRRHRHRRHRRQRRQRRRCHCCCHCR